MQAWAMDKWADDEIFGEGYDGTRKEIRYGKNELYKMEMFCGVYDSFRHGDYCNFIIRCEISR